jgi:tryptophan-rich hypothetical protein
MIEMDASRRIQINPRKLMLSKWTAVLPLKKEKHFLVINLVKPESPEGPLEFVEMEAVFSQRSFIIPWRELSDIDRWRQGWDR